MDNSDSVNFQKMEALFTAMFQELHDALLRAKVQEDYVLWPEE